MDWSLDDELEEALALLLQAFVERQVDRGADGVGRGERRFQAARLLGQRGDRIGEDRDIGLGGGELAVVVAQLAQRALLGQHLAGKGFAAGGRTFDDLLDQAVLERFRGADRIAADDHLDRELRTDRARQALRAAGARQQAELHFGQAEPGFLDRHAKVACQRDLEAAAERGAVNGGNDRLRRILHRGQHFGRPGGFGGLPNSVMSAPAMKVRPPQVSTMRLDFGIGDRLFHAIENTAAHGGAQRIHRRAVNRDDADVVMTFELDHCVHDYSPWMPCSCVE